MAFDHVVIDLSHHNGNVDLSQAGGDGVVGVLHKATQGAAFSDPMYSVNKQKAADNRLLWGAYHFGTGEDGVTQADAFLEFVQPAADTLLVLDLEPNPHGANMTLEDARAFIVHVQAETGIFPGLYGGFYVKQLLGSTVDPTLQSCWFWLSQYGRTPVVPVNWPTWTLWQYTDGAVGPNPVAIPGVGHCDQNAYNGSVDKLKADWATGSLG